ncbi:Uncharacterised protein [uncultured archaeon]|nr:Uncharacterised protein [uncultured archaeon]
MQKKRAQMKIVISVVVVVVVLLAIFIVWQLTSSSVQSSSTTGKIVNEETEKEIKCPNKYTSNIKNQEWTYTETAKRGECSNAEDLITHYGNVEITYEFVNKNDILLSVPCKVYVKQYDLNSNTVKLLDTQYAQEITIDIPAQGVKTEKVMISLPKCYGEYGLDCKDINELPECI